MLEFVLELVHQAAGDGLRVELALGWIRFRLEDGVTNSFIKRRSLRRYGVAAAAGLHVVHDESGRTSGQIIAKVFDKVLWMFGGAGR